MPSIAHIGDPINHGGLVTSASPDVFADGRAVARVGDFVSCIEHGVNKITSAGSARTVYANGRLVALNGSVCECGALVIASGTVYVED